MTVTNCDFCGKKMEVRRKHSKNKGELMLVLNKWNGRTYKVLEITDKEVTLERDDKSTFSIAKSEYFFSYSEKRLKVVDKLN